MEKRISALDTGENISGRIVVVGRDVSTIEYGSLRDRIKQVKRYQELYGNVGAFSLFGGSKTPGRAPNPMAGGYASTLSIPMGDTAYNTMAKVVAFAVALNTAGAGAVGRIWEHSVAPRTFKTFGSGYLGMPNNQGYMWFTIIDAGTGFLVCKVTLAVESYDRHRKIPVWEGVDDQMHLATATSLATAQPTNKDTGMVALPQTSVVASAWSRLAIDIEVVTVTTTPDVAGFSIPVTVKSS